MNLHAGLHVPDRAALQAHATVRRLIAAGSILLLVAIGLWVAWQQMRPLAAQSLLLTLAVTLGPAAAYAFAYFVGLPDVLGALGTRRTNPLAQRWSDFARLTTAAGVLATWVAWGLVILHYLRGTALSPNHLPSMLQLLVLGMLASRPDLCFLGAIVAGALMMLCEVGSEEYLARTMDAASVSRATGWRAAAERIVGKCGAGIARLVSAKRALIFGSVLLLISLVCSMDVFGGFGADVVAGKQGWPTAEYTLAGRAARILSGVGRCTYVAALAIAVVALLAVVLGRYGARLRRSRWLGLLTTLIALFAACDFTLGVARLASSVPIVLNVTVLVVVGIAPAMFWIIRAKRGGLVWNRTRVAAMILYLPIVLAALALLPLGLILVPGYELFLLGTALMARGFAESRWAVG